MWQATRTDRLLTQATKGEPGPSQPSRDAGARRIDHATPPKQQAVLGQAEQELTEYCSHLPGSEESERCWTAFRYFEDKKHEAESGCEVEIKDGKVAEECAKLEHFEDFARQMIGGGSARNFVRTLFTLSNAERKQLARQIENLQGSESSLSSMDLIVDSDVERERLIALFETADTNGDGVLNVAEFRAAMKSLGDELSGNSVAIIFDALDAHGNINVDQFITIVEAENVRSHTRDAKLLRALSRGFRNKK
ncbi:hypothetical protein WJX72_010034 [[Myrmecia] bisecta]|uniref:EF-hand domain-containing protein n=1 Tax=[Myrmecia] bisecta TaxID=41462 RepID=A0AAW1PY11_9CHLO